MPQEPYPIGGIVYASDASTAYPGVTVTCRNITRKTKSTFTSDEVDGSYAFNLANPEFGGYATSDSIELIARIGCFYKRETHTVVLGGAEDINFTLALEDNIRILDLFRLNQELITFFRANLIDPRERGTIRTETQSGTGSKVKFSLAESNIKFIKSITVGGTLQTEWSNYYVDYKDKDTLSNASIYFLTPPSNDSAVEFIYTYGTQSWVYPDKPRIDISLDSYPRVSVNVFPVNTREGGMGGGSNISNMAGMITVLSTKSNEVLDLLTQIRRLIIENKKGFHHYGLITLGNTSPLITTSYRGNRIIQANQGIRVPLKLEKVEN